MHSKGVCYWQLKINIYQTPDKWENFSNNDIFWDDQQIKFPIQSIAKIELDLPDAEEKITEGSNIAVCLKSQYHWPFILTSINIMPLPSMPNLPTVKSIQMLMRLWPPRGSSCRTERRKNDHRALVAAQIKVLSILISRHWGIDAMSHVSGSSFRTPETWRAVNAD